MLFCCSVSFALFFVIRVLLLCFYSHDFQRFYVSGMFLFLPFSFAFHPNSISIFAMVAFCHSLFVFRAVVEGKGFHFHIRLCTTYFFMQITMCTFDFVCVLSCYFVVWHKSFSSSLLSLMTFAFIFKVCTLCRFGSFLLEARMSTQIIVECTHVSRVKKKKKNK